MTTKNSPIHQLRKQARVIAEVLAKAERGERIEAKFADKLYAARNNPGVKIGVVMDDKIVIIEMEWVKIKGTTLHAMEEYIVGLMREQQDTMQ